MKLKALLFFLLLGFSAQIASASTTLPPLEDAIVTIDLSVYPNPTSGTFFVQIADMDPQANYQVKVVDLIGKVLIEREVTANERTRFDLSTAPKGIYFVQIIQGKEKTIKRVVVQ